MSHDSGEGLVRITTSTFFIDAVDACLPATSHVLMALGDSLNDGTTATLNGHDRWTDVLQRALWAADRRKLAVVIAGIDGKQVTGRPPVASASRGGPAAVERIQLDLLSLSNVRTA